MKADRARLVPGFGLEFPDLYRSDGLARLDARFVDWLHGRSPDAAGTLARLREEALRDPSARADAQALIEIGDHLDAFVGELFGISEALDALAARIRAAEPLVRTKWKFVKRQAVLGTDPAAAQAIDADATRAELTAAGASPDDEERFAQAIADWQAQARSAQDPARARALLDKARRYAAWAAITDSGRRRHRDGTLFRLPVPLDPAGDALLGTRTTVHGVALHRERTDRLSARDGFDLTDPGIGTTRAVDEARYCLACHRQGTDSCSHGILAPGTPATAPAFRRDAGGVPMTGCPLEERISEFLWLQQTGHPVGALAMIAVDNPLVAATGHRICNDCSKACVFQQQTPVDIPAAETRVLRDVLELPWGVEIYSLFTRWNPLNPARPVPAAATGRAVLVVGMGPAGFALAHLLLNAGHTVVGIDGLKIEPLPSSCRGTDADAGGLPFGPIRDVAMLAEPGGRRIGSGFGGVAEYGITARWDKNFLTLIRLLLERRERFALYGGVRFGGTVDTEGAMALGFDHVALATGAGRPTVLDIPGALARGVRMASDFLMALQSTGAARRDSIANLQVRLPVVVFGGGLTAIDTATESLAYYAVQVERYLARHEALAATGADGARAALADDPADLDTIAEFLTHGAAIRDERRRASRAGEPPRIAALLRAWGGATVVYRRALAQSPAFRLNREEVAHAIAEGVDFADRLEPVSIEVDAQGAARAVRLCSSAPDSAGAGLRMPARSIFIAVGTAPNTTVADEDPAYRRTDAGLVLQDALGRPVRAPAGAPKAPGAAFIVRRMPDGRAVTQFGDLHPSFAGSVVRALASARQGHALVDELVSTRVAPPLDFATLRATLDGQWRASVLATRRLGPRIVEVVVRAPAAARAFRPGQFFRLQNFERTAPKVRFGGTATPLAMEGLALTGAAADAAAGTVTAIVLETGGSADLCARLAPGEPVVLMGPTGEATEIPAGETVVLVGGGLGNAVLFSIGAALRAAGSRVLYFAGYRTQTDAFRRTDIEAAADTVVWCTQDPPGIAARRPQDLAWQGTVVDALTGYAALPVARQPVPLAEADRVLAIGPDAMMAAVAGACRHELASALRPDVRLLASIDSPMQCMMKAICAQCLQSHTDPATGARRYLFSCASQDQSMVTVDFDCLRGRLAQNRACERQTARWLRECLARDDPARIRSAGLPGSSGTT